MKLARLKRTVFPKLLKLCKEALERAKGIEPSTYSLGSTRVSNNIKSLAAKLCFLRANGINGLPVECKTGGRFPTDNTCECRQGHYETDCCALGGRTGATPKR